MQEQKKISIPLIIGGLVLIITIGAGITFAVINANGNLNNTTALSNTNNTSSTNSSNSNGSTSSNNSGSSNNNGNNNNLTLKYKDGSYTATGSYSTPDGTESISVVVKVESNIISDVTVTSLAKDRESQQYNRLFVSGIKGVVVGKSLDTTFAPRNVNGSSLTIYGFDRALQTIRQEAVI